MTRQLWMKVGLLRIDHLFGAEASGDVAGWTLDSGYADACPPRASWLASLFEMGWIHNRKPKRILHVEYIDTVLPVDLPFRVHSPLFPSHQILIMLASTFGYQRRLHQRPSACLFSLPIMLLMVVVISISIAASFAIFRTSHDLLLTKYAGLLRNHSYPAPSFPTNDTVEVLGPPRPDDWDWEPEDPYTNYAATIKMKTPSNNS